MVNISPLYAVLLYSPKLMFYIWASLFSDVGEILDDFDAI